MLRSCPIQSPPCYCCCCTSLGALCARCAVRVLYLFRRSAAEHSSTLSMDTGENTAQCPGHCCVLGGHRLLCPRWTQPRTQSHCASGIVKPVAQVQMLDATIRLLLILLLVVGSGQWAHSPVGPRILPKIPTCILCNEHWRAFKGYFLCTFSSNLNSEKYSFGFWRLVGVSRALV